MFNDLLNEVKADKKKLVEGAGGKNVNVVVGPGQTNKNVAKKEVDDIEDMLANLWMILASKSKAIIMHTKTYRIYY